MSEFDRGCGKLLSEWMSHWPGPYYRLSVDCVNNASVDKTRICFPISAHEQPTSTNLLPDFYSTSIMFCYHFLWQESERKPIPLNLCDVVFYDIHCETHAIQKPHLHITGASGHSTVLGVAFIGIIR